MPRQSDSHRWLLSLALLMSAATGPGLARAQGIDPRLPSCNAYYCRVNAGFVDVGVFDERSDGIMGTDEVQCAVNCLDGDLEGEYSIDPASPSSLPRIPGGTLHFRPGIKYVLTHPVRLPLAVDGNLVIDGGGSTLTLARDSGQDAVAIFERLVPASSSTCLARDIAASSSNWVVRNLTFRALGESPTPLVPARAIHVEAMTDLRVQHCVFDGAFDAAVNGAFMPSLSVRDSSFKGIRRGIAVESAPTCAVTGGQSGCWTDCGPESTLANDGLTVRSCRFVHGTPGCTSIDIQDSPFASIDECSFRASRAGSFIRRKQSRTVQGRSLLMVRGPLLAGSLNANPPWIDDQATGDIAVQGLVARQSPESLPVAERPIVLRVSDPQAHVGLSDWSVLPLGFALAAPSTAEVTALGVTQVGTFGNASLTQPIDSRGRWRGDLPRIVVADPERWKLPLDPPTSGGALGLNTSTSRLSACCDADGRPFDFQVR